MYIFTQIIFLVLMTIYVPHVTNNSRLIGIT